MKKFILLYRSASTPCRRGFTLVELLLFLGIVGIMGTTLVAVFVSTQDARIRQQSIASLEQRSGQLLEIFTRRIRRAEAILLPPAGQTAPYLALQMALESEYPTIFAQSGTTIAVVEHDTRSAFLSDQIQVANVSFKNVGGTSAIVSFDLSIVIPLPVPSTYRRHFDVAVALFPTDQSIAGGCGSCAAPVCTAHLLHWNYCASGVCTVSTNDLPC